VLGQRGAEPHWLGDAVRACSPPLDRASALTSATTVIPGPISDRQRPSSAEVSTWAGEDSLPGWDGLPVALLVLDEHLLEVGANRAWRALAGTPEGESNWLEALAPDTRLLAVEQLGTVLAGTDLAQVEWRLARDDVSWVLVGATVHHSAGGQRVVVAALDRSVSHQREERLELRVALDPLTGALTGREFTRLVRVALTRRHAGRRTGSG